MATAATKDRIGTKSGISAASISMPTRLPFLTYIPWELIVISAPIALNMLINSLSPCKESIFNPFINNPSSSKAPAQIQNAPLDQSPSTSRSLRLYF